MVWQRLPTYLPSFPLRLVPLSQAQRSAYEATGFVKDLVFKTVPSVGKVRIRFFCFFFVSAVVVVVVVRPPLFFLLPSLIIPPFEFIKHRNQPTDQPTISSSSRST